MRRLVTAPAVQPCCPGRSQLIMAPAAQLRFPGSLRLIAALAAQPRVHRDTAQHTSMLVCLAQRPQ